MEMEEKTNLYRRIRKNIVVWGSIYTGLALALALIAGISSDPKTSNTGLALAVVISSICLLIFTAISLKLKKTG